MDTTIQKVGIIDNVKLFFDPLRKDDSFLVMTKGNFKMGFVTHEIILETGFDIKWDNVSGIMGGFFDLETFQKIKQKINEQVK